MSLMFARPAQWVELFGMLFLFKMRSFLCTLLLCNKMIREVWGGEGAIPIKKFEMDALKWHILVHSGALLLHGLKHVCRCRSQP